MILEKYAGKSAVVIGDTGFLGSYLVKELLAVGADVTGISTSYRTPEKNYRHLTLDLLKDDLPYFPNNSYVFHCAGYNGGIDFNIKKPYDIFYRNTLLALKIVENALDSNVMKLISLVASCAYGDEAHVDYPYPNLHAEYFLNGEPNPTVVGHAYGKRNLHIASILSNRQNGTNYITICPSTLIGPGDCLELNKTKVGMAIIKKVVEAKRKQEKSITFWGTGSPYRDFVDVQDAAKCILIAGQKYDNSIFPLNISFANEFKIRELVDIVVKLCEYDGEIIWDKSKPDGQYRKKLDNGALRVILNDEGFTVTDFKDTLQRTIKWYENLQS